MTWDDMLVAETLGSKVEVLQFGELTGAQILAVGQAIRRSNLVILKDAFAEAYTPQGLDRLMWFVDLTNDFAELRSGVSRPYRYDDSQPNEADLATPMAS